MDEENVIRLIKNYFQQQELVDKIETEVAYPFGRCDLLVKRKKSVNLAIECKGGVIGTIKVQQALGQALTYHLIPALPYIAFPREGIQGGWQLSDLKTICDHYNLGLLLLHTNPLSESAEIQTICTPKVSFTNIWADTPNIYGKIFTLLDDQARTMKELEKTYGEIPKILQSIVGLLERNQK